MFSYVVVFTLFLLSVTIINYVGIEQEMITDILVNLSCQAILHIKRIDISMLKATNKINVALYISKYIYKING